MSARRHRYARTYSKILNSLPLQGAVLVVENNLAVKHELAALAIKFGGLLKRNGDLLVIKKCKVITHFRLFTACISFTFRL